MGWGCRTHEEDENTQKFLLESLNVRDLSEDVDADREVTGT
jgi:hypothetical protein